MKIPRLPFVAWLSLPLLFAAAGCTPAVTPIASGGWIYRHITLNPGTRSEHAQGQLQYQGHDLAAGLGRIVTPIGEFTFVRGAGESWQPKDAPGWTRQTELSPEAGNRTTAQAQEGGIEFAKTDADRGWYFGAFDQRRRGTSAAWFFSTMLRAWLDPERGADYGKLLAAHEQLARLVKAIGAFEERVGHCPGQLGLLLTGPADAGKPWAALAAADDLTDPWGNRYEIEVFARSHAREQGRGFAITSPGPDRRTGTADDLSAPEPVNPRPPRFEARPE